MSMMYFLTPKSSEAVPEMFSTALERMGGDQEVMDAAMHYRQAEIRAFAAISGNGRLYRAMAADPALIEGVSAGLARLQSDVTVRLQKESVLDREAGPKLFELYHDIRVARECFMVHLDETMSFGEKADPEASLRFARWRMGLEISCREFYAAMDLLPETSCHADSVLQI